MEKYNEELLEIKNKIKSYKNMLKSYPGGKNYKYVDFTIKDNDTYITAIEKNTHLVHLFYVDDIRNILVKIVD